jgi:hypothetical protein
MVKIEVKFNFRIVFDRRQPVEVSVDVPTEESEDRLIDILTRWVESLPR